MRFKLEIFSRAEHESCPKLGDLGKEYCFDWVRHIAKAAVIVLNAGAHVLPLPVFERLMEGAATSLKDHKVGPQQIIYRTAPQGHPDCRLTDQVRTGPSAGEVPGWAAKCCVVVHVL